VTSPQDKHDPGGKVRILLKDSIHGDATFSECGRYRPLLSRDWTPQGETSRSILWLGMNPSTACAQASDPTINREMTFSKDWGFTRYIKGNMLDYRATNPKDLPLDPNVACSSDNLPAILSVLDDVEKVILAYGKLHARYQSKVREVIEALRDAGATLECLGLNQDGSAKHPLYLKKTLTPFPFPSQG
jgi:hypothetical protein